MSFNIYESTQGIALNEIYDIQINPDCCSINPFSNYDSADDTLKNYTINITQDGYQVENLENVLLIPENIDSLSIFLRYYDNHGDSFANVELPFVSVFNTLTNEEIVYPNNFNLTEISDLDQFDDILLPLFPLFQLDENIRFYNFSSGVLFSNVNTTYLATGITKNPNEVYMIRFLPPTFPETVEDYSTADVRYWSMNKVNEDTNNFWGMKNQQFIIADSDGFVNIVIADPSDEIIEHSAGLIFFPWNVPNNYMF